MHDGHLFYVFLGLGAVSIAPPPPPPPPADILRRASRIPSWEEERVTHA